MSPHETAVERALEKPLDARASARRLSPRRDVVTAEIADQILRPLFSHDAEEFWALALGPKKTILGHRMLFRGTVDSCQVHPREIFRFACLENASALLVAHNHPSGDLEPSPEDIRFTRELIHAGRLMEIPIVDHLILTRSGFSSFQRDGWGTRSFSETPLAAPTRPLIR